ncbi:NADPH-dependent F420 reductase [Nocardia sp. 2]|uniref:NADPH-dependent F420 reductase n=1 Tax=Nocardia acididurans TaxID=2802282 RepID=A0ABS1MH77_9NOCA|nr:NADPH-dependent F420 reductase [Nocardia acididurans]MBL1079934.1 NADPH-dependent F420 reductase [Nocardia acididurans]
MTTFGIIGAGNMGRAIATRLGAAGHTVLIGDESPGKAGDLAAEVGAGVRGVVRATDVDTALDAEIVVLAVWYPGTVDIGNAHRQRLGGKIVIDIANPLDEAYTGLTLPSSTSAAEELAKALPDSRIVKAFNTVPAPVLTEGVLDDLPMDTFVAGDDTAARKTVLDLLDGTGLRGLDAGVLANSRLLERLTAFGIELGQRYGLGFEFGFKFVPTTF